jgi:hypothetical protein
MTRTALLNCMSQFSSIALQLKLKLTHQWRRFISVRCGLGVIPLQYPSNLFLVCRTIPLRHLSDAKCFVQMGRLYKSLGIVIGLYSLVQWL